MPTVLAVDDNPAQLYATTKLLRREGFEVWEAQTGQGALDKARDNPDLIVLDIKLPDISGVEVCKRLKTDPSTTSIPVLHLTATYGAGEDQAAALEAGADAYLTQPVEPIVFVATVRALLRARAAEAQARQVTAWWQTTFDAIGDGVALLDRNGAVLRVNRAMAGLLGAPAEDLLGRPGTPALPGMDRPAEGWPAERAMRERVRASAEVVLGERCFELVADPVRDESGRVSSVVHTIKEITERKVAEARLAELLEREQAARREAEQVNRLKDEFLATLS
ncbi:MAG TPA: response regulator, partial [Vicinamibacteria bacterium]